MLILKRGFIEIVTMILSKQLLNFNNSQNLDTPLIIAKKLTERYLITELNNMINDDSFGTAISKNVLETYINHLKLTFYNDLQDKSNLVKEIYLLYLISRSLYDLNFIHFNISYEEFRAKILYPNMLYILVKFCNESKKFIQANIKQVYNEVSNRSYGMVQKYVNSYYLSEDIIKNDILFKFVGNALRKFDPLELINVNAFYKQVFRNIFYYYFKREQNVHTQLSNVSEIDTSLSQLTNVPVRLLIYRDVLYKLQIEKFCNDSPTLFQLNYNYNIFKKTIFDNEFQNLYFTSDNDIFMLNNNQYKVLNIYNEDICNNNKLFRIRELPIIYKLLKCVHINNPNCRAYNERYIKPSVVKTAILDEITYPFRNMFTENHLYSIMNKVAENFSNKILCGEYINLLTLSTIRIDQPSFIIQIKKFVQICLEGVN